MTENEIQQLAGLLFKLAELFNDYADISEALALESYATYQRLMLFP